MTAIFKWLSEPPGSTLLGVTGLVLTVAGTALAIVGHLSSRKAYKALDQASKALEQLNGISAGIADATRKTLSGFTEIFCQTYDLLERADEAGGLWFLGVTLGFGHAHSHKQVKVGHNTKSMDDLIKALRNPSPRYSDMVARINQRLRAFANGPSKRIIVTLNPAKLGDKFLQPLSKRTYYEALRKDLDDTEEKVMELHNGVAAQLGLENIQHLDRIPFQILVVDLKKNSDGLSGRKAAIMFLVGTENLHSEVLTDGEVGFYTELPSVCEMLTRAVESFHEPD